MISSGESQGRGFASSFLVSILKLVLWECAMKYTVRIEESDEGFAVSVPGLPGCHSQGETEQEALANIADAIREYLDVIRELAQSPGARQTEVEV
jgi:predicted RNase H-like HicB family nuclease